MNITEVRIHLSEMAADRLRAYASITINSEFAVRDIKIIEGESGLFLAMPSRRITEACPECNCKNHLRARFCNECGQGLLKLNSSESFDLNQRLHVDIAHPVNAKARAILESWVFREYKAEVERSKKQSASDAPDQNFDDTITRHHEPESSQPPHVPESSASQATRKNKRP